VLVDDIIAAIEAARDKVMADETRAMIKLGLPRRMAEQTVAARFHLKVDDEEGSGSSEFDNGQWHDIS
jgi:IS4 transposase